MSDKKFFQVATIFLLVSRDEEFGDSCVRSYDDEELARFDLNALQASSRLDEWDLVTVPFFHAIPQGA